MTTFDDPIYNRITELISLLSRTGKPVTITQIAALTGTSPVQTRLDLQQLHRCGIRLHPEAVFDRLNASDTQFDDVPLSLAADIPSGHPLPEGLLFLTPLEQHLFLGKELPDLLVKDSPYAVPNEVLDRVRTIESAIRANRYVRFRYRRIGASSAETIETVPRFLYYNASDSLYYCISFLNEEIVAFRLDRILYDVHMKKKTAPPPDPQDIRLQRLPLIWGAAFSSEEPPCHVKLKITADTPNILNKIRSDTYSRSQALLYQEGNVWIYEDTVIGLSAFRSWIMSFGSSVKVLEPAHLAEEIRQSSVMRLQNYESGNTFVY